MILFWNKFEVFVGNSITQFNQIKDLLSAAGIDYTYKVVDHEGSRNIGTLRSRTGSSGISTKHSNLYYIYVHKKDAKSARTVIEHQRRII